MPFRSSLRPPPGQQDQGVRLAAPATVGQVGDTSCASLHAPGQVSRDSSEPASSAQSVGHAP